LSHAGVIHDTSIELRRQIVHALETAADIDFGLDGDVERIALSPPGDDLDDTVIASLYLYRVDVDEHRRNQRPLPDPGSPELFRRPPLPLQLRYLVTPVGGSEETNQLVLGRLVQHFHDFPVFSTLSGVPLGDSHGGADPELRVRQDPLTLEQLTQLWTAFSTPYRVSVAFAVDVVAVDSAQPAALVRRAETLVVAVGRGRR
jgi:hypothetical protein